MKRHAKASSAGSTLHQATGLGRIVRGALVTRGASSDAEGSGAPSYRGRLALLSLAALAFTGVVLMVASAFASKEVVDYIGSDLQNGTNGGEFFNPRDSAVNTSGAGPAAQGDIYVADQYNNRVQRFDEDGNFISAWGADVIEAGKPGDVAGTNPYEICTVAADCKKGAESGGNTATSGNGSLNSPQSVAVDGDSGNVYVSDWLNNRVSEYTGDGSFIRSFGFGVDETTAGEGYEVCPAADVCKAGIAGSGAGQVGETGFYSTALGLSVSPADGNAATGTVFLADTTNRRVSTYDLDGTNPSSFGSSTEFGESQPRKVAVDSRGILYASNSNGEGEIERYDTEDANGGGVGFLAPIASPPLLEGFAESATAGLAVDPDSDGAGPEEDTLYVLRGSSVDFIAAVQQFGPLNDPGLTAAPTAVDDTHGAGAGFTPSSALGLGLDDASGRLFVSSNFVPGDNNANRVYILDEAPAPGASIDPVSGIGAHSATFSGEVDPNGAPTGYHFEYVDDAEFQANGFTNAQRYPLTDARVGNSESPVAVETEIPHHLTPATTYHVRLLAKQTYAPTETASSAVTFTTTGAAPSIETAATDVEADSATLRASINPEGQAVSNYHFEWGTSNAYGSSTPAGNLPSGSSAVAVEEELSGLTPGQTYHYRLLATNGTGTTQGSDQTFTPAAAPQLPQRGYEIASQYPTGGVPIMEVTGRQSASEDGNTLAVSSPNPLPHTVFPGLPDDSFGAVREIRQYLFDRGPDGWKRVEAHINGFGWSGDLKRLILSTYTDGPGSGAELEDPRLDPDDHTGAGPVGGPGALDVYQRQPDGSLVWISRDPRIPVGTPQTGGEGIAEVASFDGSFTMSADGRTVVFKSNRQLLDADTTQTNEFRLYKWHDGHLSFIGILPDGSVPGNGSSLGDEFNYTRYAVSRDGSRVVFRSGRRLYVQTDGQPTAEASKEEGVPPLTGEQPYQVSYRGAAADDSRVFFTSASRLTPDSGAGVQSFEGAKDLYAYDVETDTLRDLTPRLDGLDDPSASPPLADRADVLGVAANSSDGKRVYFVANAQYPTAPNPEGDLPSGEGRNLYMAELDRIEDPIELRFIAALGSEDGGDWQQSWRGGSGANNGKTTLASNDGSVLGFRSTESLTGQPLGGTGQLFVYDADSGTLACPSCPGDGSLPARSVNEYTFAVIENRAEWQGDMALRRWVSSDGTVFFNTTTALLPGDQNEVTDVYEYRDGALGLITTGTATANSLFSNASVDASTVFFNTQAALVPQDKEPGVNKIYAARVGGGFPYVPPASPCDFNAGACEGAPSTAPATPGAGTAAFEGPGNPKPGAKRRCPKGKRKVRAKGKTRCVKRHHKKRAKRHHKRTAKNNRRASR